MKILERINTLHCAIYSDPSGIGLELANLLQEQAILAIHNGREHDDWGKYMENFADNQRQLERLKGNDEFLGKDWGPQTLAYMVSNSTCGINTFTGTRNNLTELMYNSLDIKDDGTTLDPTSDGTITHPFGI